MKSKEPEEKSERPPLPIKPEDPQELAAESREAFDLYVRTEKHGDMETDQWAWRNFNAGFKAGYLKAKGK